MKECIILAGGLGTRLRERFPNTPKCLVPVNEIPFICHQLRMLQSIGINNFILALGYKSSIPLVLYYTILFDEFCRKRLTQIFIIDC